MTSVPDQQHLIDTLAAFVDQQDMQPRALQPWNSSVYAVLDCVFSNQANYVSMVLPALKRFGERTGMLDTPELTLRQFTDDVDHRFPDEPDRFAVYAREIMGNRGKIGRQTKVEVAYHLAQFLIDKGFQTRADLISTQTGPDGEDRLVKLVLKDIVMNHGVYGIGPALGRYLLLLLGRDYFKPDTLLLRLMGELGGWSPRAGHPGDIKLMEEAIRTVALTRGFKTAAELDNQLWKYQSEKAKSARSKKS